LQGKNYLYTIPMNSIWVEVQWFQEETYAFVNYLIWKKSLVLILFYFCKIKKFKNYFVNYHNLIHVTVMNNDFVRSQGWEYLLLKKVLKQIVQISRKRKKREEIMKER